MVPITPDSKISVVGSTSLPEKEVGSQKKKLSIYVSTLAPNSPLQNPSNFGATASHWLLYFLLFFFFLIFNWMDAWSLIRGDAFIHFVCGSRRVNIRLGVLLLIPQSPQMSKNGVSSGHVTNPFSPAKKVRSTQTSSFKKIISAGGCMPQVSNIRIILPSLSCSWLRRTRSFRTPPQVSLVFICFPLPLVNRMLCIIGPVI